MHEKLDYFDPLFIAGFIMAGISDFAFLFMVGAAIPVIGQVLAVGILGVHYFVGIFLLISVIFRLQHLVPKLILGAGALLPLPTLTLGLALAIISQNRLVELVLTQAALLAVTGGVGNVAAGAAEGASVATRGAQAASAAAKGAEATAGAVEGGGAAARGTEALESAGGKAGVVRREGLRGKIQGGLEERVRQLEGEVEKEDEIVSEEDFGIVEPTDKMKELFSPEYEGGDQNIEENEIEARRMFEAQKQEEVERRRENLGQGQFPSGITENIPRPNPNMGTPATSGDEVELNQDGNEINLKKAA